MVGNSTRITRTVVQFVVCEGVNKCFIIFEPVLSNPVPDKVGLALAILQLCDNYMITVSDTTTLIMNNIIIAICDSPNQTLIGKRIVRVDVGGLPLFTRLRKLATAIGTKRKNCSWKICGGMNLVEMRNITQHFLVIGGKLSHVAMAKCLKCH